MRKPHMATPPLSLFPKGAPMNSPFYLCKASRNGYMAPSYLFLKGEFKGGSYALKEGFNIFNA